ncbi:hypothetical protein DLAC_09964 [Tieghemostelium lacteum]|uniref:Uncharacterized protein n=1 Tax=Tieghemostelium lacteum TaxID=361077 RepID=A0A151Z5T0_TIELA|nr:hypothetical protein DLAC_09964 [Tieghemostelium lacteum]|eukprot:KYQ89305.1 hypothetical protein DLAC_09964 [Tieghemostelium lacteum]
MNKENKTHNFNTGSNMIVGKTPSLSPKGQFKNSTLLKQLRVETENNAIKSITQSLFNKDLNQMNKSPTIQNKNNGGEVKQLASFYETLTNKSNNSNNMTKSVILPPSNNNPTKKSVFTIKSTSVAALNNTNSTQISNPLPTAFLKKLPLSPHNPKKSPPKYTKPLTPKKPVTLSEPFVEPIQVVQNTNPTPTPIVEEPEKTQQLTIDDLSFAKNLPLSPHCPKRLPPVEVRMETPKKSTTNAVQTPIEESSKKANEIAFQIRDTVDTYRKKIIELEEKLELSSLESESLKQELMLLSGQYHQDTVALLDIINEHEETIQDLKEDVEMKDTEDVEEDEEEVEEEEVEEEEEEEEINSDMEEVNDYELDKIQELKEKIQELEQTIEDLNTQLSEADGCYFELKTENQKNIELVNRYQKELLECQSLVIFYKEEMEKKSFDTSILTKKLSDKNEEIQKYKLRIQNFIEMMELQKELGQTISSATSIASSPSKFIMKNNSSPSLIYSPSSSSNSAGSPTHKSNGPSTALEPISTMNLNSSTNGSGYSHQTTPMPKSYKKSIPSNNRSINASSNSSLSRENSFKTPISLNLQNSLNSSLNNSQLINSGKSKTPRKVIASPRSVMEYI